MALHKQRVEPDSVPKATEPGQAGQARPVINYAKLPLSFEVNRGQTDPQVKFLSRARGYTLFLTPAESVMTLVGRAGDAQHQDERTTRIVRMKLAGANAQAEVVGLEKQPGIVNYFIGNDPSRWRTEIPTFAKVKYENVYPGVDLVYYGNQGRLEHDFVVAAGADAGAIQVAFEGVDKMETDTHGNLVLHVGVGELRLGKPEIYQVVDGVRHPIVGSYALQGRNQVSFDVAAYNTGTPLVIDPVLWYSTYHGGSGSFGDSASSVAVDAAGNAYVTGATSSDDFPVRHALQKQFAGGFSDMFVTKFSATSSAGQTPTLVYSTYLGGSDSDAGNGIAVDVAGNAYVAGSASSTNFPTTANGVQTNYGGGTGDAVVVKLNADGTSLLYSTYLGGSRGDFAVGIAVGTTGLASVAGTTSSANFPTQNAFQGTLQGPFDAFVAKLDPQQSFGNSLLYSTFLGGTTNEFGGGVAVDTSGNAYATGETRSTNFPTTLGGFQRTNAGLSDAFITKLSASGSLLYSSYLGGTGTDSGHGIAVDLSGRAYVVGDTASTNFPTKSTSTLGTSLVPLQRTLKGPGDAFVAKFVPTSSQANSLFYSTYLGGSSGDTGSAVAVNTSGQAYVGGSTGSTDFPKINAIDVTFAGLEAFVAELSGSGNSLIFSTFIGGNDFEGADGIAVQGSTNVYVVGNTQSAMDFPILAAPQPTLGNGPKGDGFLTRIGRITQPVSLQGLLDLVNSVGLPEAQQLSLSAELVIAQLQLDEGRTRPAARLVGAFIEHVVALQQSGQLDATEAEELIALAVAILQQM